MDARKKLFLALNLCLILAIFAALNKNTLAMGRDGTRITVVQTAVPVWQHEFLWSLNQSVTPEEWFLFQGDTGTTRYTVDVTKEGTQDTYGVRGKITVNNVGTVATQGLKIVNCVQYKVGTGPMGNLQCLELDLGVHPTVPANSSYAYPYEMTFDPVPEARYQTQATISITNAIDYLDQPYEAVAKAGFRFPTSPTRTINEAITVVDSNGRSWTLSESGIQTYDALLDCAGLAYVNEQAAYVRGNTAVITQTGQAAETQVTVNCYQLRITGETGGSLDLYTSWDFDKTADTSELTLNVGEQALVNYEVTLDVLDYSFWIYIENLFTVHNPNPQRQAILTSLDVGGDVDCFKPLVVASGGSLTCDYRATAEGVNTPEYTVEAKAVVQNYNLLPDGSAVATGTNAFETVFVGNVSIEGCADVYDSLAGALGPVCWQENFAPKALSYPWWIGPYQTCGTYEVENTATAVSYDFYYGELGTDSWTVQVTVPCSSE